MRTAATNKRALISVGIGTALLVVFGTIAAFAAGPTSPLPGVDLTRVVFGTIMALALVLLAARFLPRLAGAGGVPHDSFRVIASLPVGQRERVVIVQVGTRQMLLGVAAGRVEMISALDEPLSEAARNAPRPAGNWLGQVLGRAR